MTAQKACVEAQAKAEVAQRVLGAEVRSLRGTIGKQDTETLVLYEQLDVSKGDAADAKEQHRLELDRVRALLKTAKGDADMARDKASKCVDQAKKKAVYYKHAIRELNERVRGLVEREVYLDDQGRELDEALIDAEIAEDKVEAMGQRIKTLQEEAQGVIDTAEELEKAQDEITYLTQRAEDAEVALRQYLVPA